MAVVKYRPAGRGWTAVAGHGIAEAVTLRPIAWSVAFPGCQRALSLVSGMNERTGQ